MHDLTTLRHRLITLLLKTEALKFGEFETKSGRLSPYFFNFGAIATGAASSQLSELYWQLMHQSGLSTEVDGFFGPAYKGIPLAVSLANHAYSQHERDFFFSFDRKEAKDHGEGGSLVGHSFQGGERVVIIEDVLTRGTSLSHSIPLLQKLGVEVVAAVVAVDRQEMGFAGQLARAEISTRFDLPVYSIAKLEDILTDLDQHRFLGQSWLNPDLTTKIAQYRQQWSES